MRIARIAVFVREMETPREPTPIDMKTETEIESTVIDMKTETEIESTVVGHWSIDGAIKPVTLSLICSKRRSDRRRKRKRAHWYIVTMCNGCPAQAAVLIEGVDGVQHLSDITFPDGSIKYRRYNEALERYQRTAASMIFVLNMEGWSSAAFVEKTAVMTSPELLRFAKQWATCNDCNHTIDEALDRQPGPSA